jgi:hypothetical protein
MTKKNITYKAEHDDDDVYLDKLQTRGVKKSILYMWNVEQPVSRSKEK